MDKIKCALGKLVAFILAILWFGFGVLLGGLLTVILELLNFLLMLLQKLADESQPWWEVPKLYLEVGTIFRKWAELIGDSGLELWKWLMEDC